MKGILLIIKCFVLFGMKQVVIIMDKNKGSPLHDDPTMWGFGMVDVCNLTPTSRKAVSKFKLIILRSQCRVTILLLRPDSSSKQ